MVAEKENKVPAAIGSSIRLPEELKAALRREQAPYLARGEEPPNYGALLLAAWKFYKTGEPQGELSQADPFKEIRDRIESAFGQTKSQMQRIEDLARARVVEVANAEEQNLVKRIVQLLHVTGFQKRLRDLLREVEHERGKRMMTG